MKIGLIIYGSLDTVSGGYLYDRMLVETLQRQGAQVEILSLAWRNYPRHLLDNFQSALIRKIRGAQYDLLLQDELNHPSLFLLNRRLRSALPTTQGMPIVSIVHHLRSDEAHLPLFQRMYRNIEAAYLRSVDGFLVNSWTTRRRVESYLLQERPFHVAYPAGDHLSPPEMERVRRQILHHAESNALRIAFVGNVIPRKALHTVVESLILLRRNRPELQLCLDVIGNCDIAPNYVRHIKQQIQAHNLNHYVRFHGQVTPDKLSSLLLNSQVMAVPSFEGFGIVYLEAMSHGLCPIASTAGAAQEIVQHGINGLLVRPEAPKALAEHLIRLARNPEALRQYRVEALQCFWGYADWKDTFESSYLWLCEIVRQYQINSPTNR